MLTPERVKVSVPILVRAKAPPIIPLAVMLPLEPPIEELLPKVIAPIYVLVVAELLVRAPALLCPAPLIVSPSAVPRVNPFRSSVAPSLTVVPAPVVPNGVFVPPPAAPSFNVPAEIVVKPV